MKTITIDWETYEAEIMAKYKRGVEMGIWKASRYIRDSVTYPIDEEYAWEKKMLDEAIALSCSAIA